MTDARDALANGDILTALDAGQYERAFQLFEAALDGEPAPTQRAALLLARGQLYAALDDHNAARADLDAALKLASDTASRGAVYLARAEAGMSAGWIDGALTDSRLAVELLGGQPTEVAALHAHGRLERDHGDLLAAIDVLELALAAANSSAGVDVDLHVQAEITLDLAIAWRLAGYGERARALLDEALDRGPSDDNWHGRVLTQLGVTLGLLGDWAAALQTYARALTITDEPLETARLHYNRAVILRQLGKPTAACGELALATASGSADERLSFDIMLLGGVVAREGGDLPAALDALREASMLANDDERHGVARLELGATLAATGLFGLAIDEFGGAVALCREPADLARAYRYRGAARHELGLTGLALDDFSRAVHLTSEPDERARGELTRAALLLERGDGAAAFAALGRACYSASLPETIAQARFQRGSLATERGEIDTALANLRFACDAACAARNVLLEAQSQLNYGVALTIADRLDEAIDAFLHAAELAGNLAERGTLAQLAWFNLARLLASADRAQAAIDAFEQAATAAEDNRDARADAFLARGNALVRWGRYVEADADFTRVLALQPTDALQAQARYSRGLTRSLLGQLERARDDLTETIAGSRDRDHRAQALLDRGLVALAAGDFAGAERDLAAAAESFRRRTSRAVAHVHLAVVLAQQGRCDASAVELRKAFALDRAGDAHELARREPRLRLCEDVPGYPLALPPVDDV